MRRVLVACAPASVRLTVGAGDRQVRPPSGLTSRQPTVLLTYLSLFVRIPVCPPARQDPSHVIPFILFFNIFLPSSDAVTKTRIYYLIVRIFLFFSSFFFLHYFQINWIAQRVKVTLTFLFYSYPKNHLLSINIISFLQPTLLKLSNFT